MFAMVPRVTSSPLADEARGEAPGRGRLAGRRILIVGGGQQDHGLEDPPMGNGRATSVLCAREGAAVVVADIDADAADEDGVGAMFAAAGDALSGLDGLVLNVGIGGGWMLKGTSAEDWDRVMAVNLRSQFLGCK